MKQIKRITSSSRWQGSEQRRFKPVNPKNIDSNFPASALQCKKFHSSPSIVSAESKLIACTTFKQSIKIF